MIPLLVVAGAVGAAVAVNAFQDDDSEKNEELGKDGCADIVIREVTREISEDEVPAHIRRKFLEENDDTITREVSANKVPAHIRKKILEERNNF